MVVQSRRPVEETRAVTAFEWFVAHMSDRMRAQLINICERSRAMATLKRFLLGLGNDELLSLRRLRESKV